MSCGCWVEVLQHLLRGLLSIALNRSMYTIITMYRQLVCIVMFLVVSGVVYAAETPPPAPSVPTPTATPVTEANRFLSAEVAKQIQAEQEVILQKVNDNNDANFKELDNQMRQLMVDTKMKVIIGGIGAILIANAVVGLVLARYWKKYSYEQYQRDVIVGKDGVIGEQKKQLDELRSAEQMQQMQQQVWYPQEVPQSVETMFGSTAVANMSQMNAWQSKPVYGGAWQSPLDVERYDFMPQPWANVPSQEKVDRDWG